jgi:capsular exopolysaccharide synthesis family protein
VATLPAPTDAWSQPPALNAPLVRVSWTRYLSALRRNKWLMLVVVLLGAGTGFLLTRRLTPEYEVHATLWISHNTNTPVPGRAEPIRAGEQMRQTSWPDLVTSFAILESVVRRMSLNVIPARPADTAVLASFTTDEQFRPGTYELRVDESGWQYQLLDEDGAELQAGVLGDSIGRPLGFRWRPTPTTLGPGRAVEFTVVTPREAALALRRNVKIAFSQESNLLGLTLTGSDPQRITAIMSALLDEFTGIAAELKRRNVTEVAKALKQQLDHAERELKDAEMALERFRVHTITLPSEVTGNGDADATQSPLFETFFTRRTEYEDVRRRRIGLENTLTAVQRGEIAPSALWSAAAVDSNAPPELRAALTELAMKQTELRAARRTFTDEHKTVRDLIAEIETLTTQAIPPMVATVISELKRQEDGLASQIQSTARELRDIPNRTTEEIRLRRNLEARSSLFATLKSRYEEATLAEASTVPDVSILDRPVAPQHPGQSRAPYVILLAVVVSIALAIALALIRDRMDTRFRYAEQATNELGLEVVGVVPALAHGALESRDPEEESQLVEAFRGIRLNLMHAFDGNGGVRFTVSSPGPGDGKSLVCAHLALSFAEAGCRTLLIDGDLRRGQLHGRFNIERRPGLLDYLESDVALEEVLKASGYKDLTLIPRGRLHQRAPELLMSPKMSRLMDALEPRYDAIIVDSPPLGAGIDPFVLGTTTGSMMLVLRSGETDRRMAEAKLKVVQRLPIHLLGVVLNDLRDEGTYPYYAYLPSDLSEDRPRAGDTESQLADLARRTMPASAEKR